MNDSVALTNNFLVRETDSEVSATYADLSFGFLGVP